MKFSEQLSFICAEIEDAQHSPKCTAEMIDYLSKAKTEAMKAWQCALDKESKR